MKVIVQRVSINSGKFIGYLSNEFTHATGLLTSQGVHLVWFPEIPQRLHVCETDAKENMPGPNS